MNEFQQQLYDRIRKGYIVATITEEDFSILVNEICKAQRNACKRVYADNLFDDTYTAIANAEIKRQDYE